MSYLRLRSLSSQSCEQPIFSYLQALPDELLLHCLRFLTAVDLANVAYVFDRCQSLPDIKHETSLWKCHTPMDNYGNQDFATWEQKWNSLGPNVRMLIRDRNLDLDIFSTRSLTPFDALDYVPKALAEMERSIRGPPIEFRETFEMAVKSHHKYGLDFDTQNFEDFGDALMRTAGYSIQMEHAEDAYLFVIVDAATFCRAHGMWISRQAAQTLMEQCCRYLAKAGSRRELPLSDLVVTAMTIDAVSSMTGFEVPQTELKGSRKALRYQARHTRDYSRAEGLRAVDGKLSHLDNVPRTLKPAIVRVSRKLHQVLNFLRSS